MVNSTTDLDSSNAKQLHPRSFAMDYQFALIAILLFAALPIAMIWDIPLASSLDLEQFPGDIKKLILISEAFSHGLGAAIILLLALVLTDQPKTNLIRPILGVILAGVVANCSKLIILRFRPHYFWEKVGQDGWDAIATSKPETFGDWLPLFSNDDWTNSQLQSFPSAHSAIAMSLAIGLSHAFPKGRFLFLFLALLAGLQRIACHAHWPSDVIGGFIVGLIVSALVGVRFPTSNNRSTASNN